MRKRVSLQCSITLSVLSISLLAGAIGLAYSYWQTKYSFREAIGLGFQELARQSADKLEGAFISFDARRVSCWSWKMKRGRATFLRRYILPATHRVRFLSCASSFRFV